MYRKTSTIAVLTTIVAVFAVILIILLVNESSWNQFVSSYITSKENQIDYYIENAFVQMEEEHIKNIGFLGTVDESGVLIRSTGDSEALIQDILIPYIKNQGSSGDSREILFVDDQCIMFTWHELDNSEVYAGNYRLVGRYIDENLMDDMQQHMDNFERLSISVTEKRQFDKPQHQFFSNFEFSIPLTYGDGFFNISLETPEMGKLISRTRNFIIILMAATAVIASFLFIKYMRKLSNTMDETISAIKKVSESDYKEHIEIDEKKMTVENKVLMDAVNQLTDDFNEKIKAIDQQYFTMIDLMADAIEINDAYTSFHNQSVGNYAKLLGNALGYEDMDNLIIAARLHDIGKIGIPSDVLNKNGKLTEKEFVIIKRHPQIGYQLINNITFFDQAKIGIKYHHEHWDGSGYPDGLRGDEIPVMAQIISIADVFDALTSDRPYRAAMNCEEALKIITDNRGVMFNPKFVDVFVGLVDDMIQNTDQDSVVNLRFLLNTSE